MTITIRLVFALLGALAAVQAISDTDYPDRYRSAVGVAIWVGSALGGALAGWLLGVAVGSASARAFRRVVAAATTRSAGELVVGGLGLLLGLGIAALLSLPISRLPFVGTYILLPLFLALGYVFAIVAGRMAPSILRLVGVSAARFDPGERRRGDASAKLVDTSAIIDGRLPDLLATGFVEGELVVPLFVLEELQHVADSPDPQRRARGRRGLDVVEQLRASHAVSTPEVVYRDLTEVDAKLLRLAVDRGAAILTTDYNLNKVARIQGVRVLNVNDLANALKPAVLPGETLQVKVIREGKEAEQGIGYLDDGTMIVVEGGRRRLGESVDVEVTSVLQSPSGKMIFSRMAASRRTA
jgi:uncharacterized protein YacL